MATGLYRCTSSRPTMPGRSCAPGNSTWARQQAGAADCASRSVPASRPRFAGHVWATDLSTSNAASPVGAISASHINQRGTVCERQVVHQVDATADRLGGEACLVARATGCAATTYGRIHRRPVELIQRYFVGAPPVDAPLSDSRRDSGPAHRLCIIPGAFLSVTTVSGGAVTACIAIDALCCRRRSSTAAD